MNNLYRNFSSIVTSTSLILVAGCVSTVDMGRTGKYSRKDVNDKKISSDNVGISINLFDLKTKKPLNVDDVKDLPGNVVETTANSQLLVFHKDSIPQSIRIDKPGKSSIIFHPELSKKNLFIYKIYLAPDMKGVM